MTKLGIIFFALILTSAAVFSGCHERSDLEKTVDDVLQTKAAANADGSRIRADAKLCDTGNARGCSDLATSLNAIYETDHDAVDPCFIANLFEDGCKGDQASACYGLGRYHLYGTCVDKDPRLGRALLQKACKGGEQLACGLLEKKPEQSE